MDTVIGTLIALVTFFAFPAFQYLLLKRLSEKEGTPELWYLPQFKVFRLVIRNIPGNRALFDIKTRGLARKVVPRSQDISVATYMDELLVEQDDLFLFPGTDQVILSFRLDADEEQRIWIVASDKLGQERKRIALAQLDVLICDYSATVQNVLNFNIRLQKRAEIRKASLERIWQAVRDKPVEASFPLDRVRSVG